MLIEPGHTYRDKRGRLWKVLRGNSTTMQFIVMPVGKTGPTIIMDQNGKDLSSARWPVQLVEECE